MNQALPDTTRDAKVHQLLKGSQSNRTGAREGKFVRNRRNNVSTAIPDYDRNVQLAPLISPTHSLHPWNNDL